MIQTMRIPRLERQLNAILNTARDIEVVELTMEKLLDIIVRQEEEIQRLRRKK